jgi:hypothetical protein
MTWHQIVSFQAAGSEGRDCKPRLRGRNSSVRDQQVRLEEFPNRANRFRRFWGAAIVGSLGSAPVSGRSTDSVCQETGNTGANSHPQAAPDRQVSRRNIAVGMSHRLLLARHGQPESRRPETALNSTLRSRAYIDTCPLRAVDTERPHDKIERAKRYMNSIGSMISPPLDRTLRQPAGSVGLKSSAGGWGSQMSISSDESELFAASTRCRLEGLGLDALDALRACEGSWNRRNSANHLFQGRFFVVDSLGTPHTRLLWHTSCSDVLHDADPSVEPGKLEAE